MQNMFYNKCYKSGLIHQLSLQVFTTYVQIPCYGGALTLQYRINIFTILHVFTTIIINFAHDIY